MIRTEEMGGVAAEIQHGSAEILSLTEIRRRAADLIEDPEARKAVDAYLVMAAGLDQLVEGVANKRLFNQKLEESVARAQRTGIPLTLLLCDLDNFKPFNDKLGHKVGDEVLQKVGNNIKRHTRITDTVARLGGDEFGIILPDTSLVHSLVVADRVLTSIPNIRPTVTQNSLVPQLGVSIGIAQFAPGENAQTFFERADTEGLLIAKQQEGKNAIGLALHPGQHLSFGNLRSTILSDTGISSQQQVALINHILDKTFLTSK